MTPLPPGLAGHVHISEREVAHHWPDGRFDNAAYEDCQVCAGVMQARLAFDLDIPPLHREAEALRADEGEDPHGGTGTDDLIRGFRERYGFTKGLTKVAGSSGLITALKPGTVATVQGWMGAFPRDHRLRRWQRSFFQAHGVMIARPDQTTRYWWDDPLAPTGSYQGEWITRDEVCRFVDALAAHFTPLALVAPITAQIQLPDTATEALGRVRVRPGFWWDYRVTGNRADGYEATRIQRPTDRGFSAEISSKTPPVEWKGEERQWARLSSGVYQGRWVDLNDEGSVSLLAA